jgi:hypothetical protein
MVLFYNRMGPPSYMRSVVDRNVAMRRMTIDDHSTETMTYQYNFFILQVAIHNNVTIHSKTQWYSTNFLHTAKDDAIYSTLNAHSGPVHLSCPPQCHRLSLLLTGEQPVRTCKGFSHVIYHTWAAAGGCEMFLRKVICSTFCKVHSQAPDTAAVLEGQDSKTSVQNGNSYSWLAQSVRETKLYITGTNINVTDICLWEQRFVTTATVVQWLYTTCFTTHSAIKQTAHTLYILWTVHRDTHTWERPTRCTLFIYF